MKVLTLTRDTPNRDKVNLIADKILKFETFPIRESGKTFTIITMVDKTVEQVIETSEAITALLNKK